MKTYGRILGLKVSGTISERIILYLLMRTKSLYKWIPFIAVLVFHFTCRAKQCVLKWYLVCPSARSEVLKLEHHNRSSACLFKGCGGRWQHSPQDCAAAEGGVFLLTCSRCQPPGRWCGEPHGALLRAPQAFKRLKIAIRNNFWFLNQKITSGFQFWF